MPEQLTVSSMSISIMEDMLLQIIQDIIARTVLEEKVTRETYGTINDPIPINSINPLTNNINHSNDGESLLAIRKLNKGNNHSNGSNGNSQASSVTGTPQPSDLQLQPDLGRFAFVRNGKDIYANALSGSQGNGTHNGTNGHSASASELYFKCSNCDRKIAGSRFAAHIDKCLGGRTRK
ncbi:unnamed protein product [Ambrosiozyma monospora]|uniref:SAGA-associated factor 11 n=1 Tax=Ambrosiozyma monospora TaxID=43982 RepID=A0A9W6YS42_AMBMO|nr:unnamed protein product [Ambrosiozyma monospora]